MSKRPKQIFGELLMKGREHPASSPDDFAKQVANSKDKRVVSKYLALITNAIENKKLFEVTENGGIIAYESAAAHYRRLLLEATKTRVLAESASQQLAVNV